MFTIFNDDTKSPIKVWVDSVEDLDEGCLEQAKNLSNLPFIHKWVSLMPDTHKGVGMPIGGVIATKNVIIPNAVGVDIGCGMIFSETNIRVSDIKHIETGSGSLIHNIIGDILRNVPVGPKRFKNKMPCDTIDKAFSEMHKYDKNEELVLELSNGYYQIGTLGGGNHFIELQTDENDMLCIMIHSGSRHFGKKVCDHFNTIAKEQNNKLYSNVPEEYNLAYLPVNSDEGRQYINWMNLALDFAYENREKMLISVQDTIERLVNKHLNIEIKFFNKINCHHNYASLENHFDENVWVHRKGATRARIDDIAVIPGAMGSKSYVVKGLGDKDSFCSSSHGAGRKYSRTMAMETFTTEQVMLDLKDKGIILGKNNKKDVAEESRFAYKDIDVVMENQKDLVKIIKTLETVGVVKG